MKTLHLTNAWHATSGGIATFYRAMLETANQRGQRMRLIVPAKEEYTEEVGDYGRIYHLTAPAALVNPEYRTIYPNRYLWPGTRIQQIIQEERPDVIEICDKYCFNYLGAVVRLGLMRAIDYRPVVVGLSCERMDENVGAYLSKGKAAQVFSRLYMKWLYFPFFDHHIANSTHTAEELQAVSKGHPVRRGVWVRPMGVDFDGLSPEWRSAEVRQQLVQQVGGTDASRLLLYVGRLVPEKNLGLLLETLALLVNKSSAEYRLLVVGEGIEREAFQQAAEAKLPGRVTFLGHVCDREQLARLYANCDVFVHPNPREPFGIAPLEAMASGLPLVAPNAGGVMTYANPQNAWVVPAEAASFADAIASVFTEQKLRHARVKAARVTAEQYRWENATAGFLALYRELHEHGLHDAAAMAEQPLFWSEPSTETGGRVIATVAGVARHGFAALANRKAGSKPKKADAESTEPAVL
ncbi:MAG: glycosyltransferase [Acidobacteriaceae bacterium]